MSTQAKKEYTVSSFKRTLYDKAIEATGSISPSLAINDCINYSGILTKLIHVAGRLVDYYASDLFITWQNVIKDMEHDCETVFYGRGDAPSYGKSTLFGFREMGVDSNTIILNKYNNGGPYYYGCDYRELWRLDYTVYKNGNIEMSLYKLDKNI